MVAQELRIGNLIEQGVIEMMSQNAVWINEKLLLIDEIQPIPLTEEWLLKFGFEKFKGNNTDCFLDNFETSCNMELFFWKGTQIKNINYVHQLQNLYFALTEKELTL